MIPFNDSPFVLGLIFGNLIFFSVFGVIYVFDMIAIRKRFGSQYSIQQDINSTLSQNPHYKQAAENKRNL